MSLSAQKKTINTYTQQNNTIAISGTRRTIFFLSSFSPLFSLHSPPRHQPRRDIGAVCVPNSHFMQYNDISLSTVFLRMQPKNKTWQPFRCIENRERKTTNETFGKKMKIVCHCATKTILFLFMFIPVLLSLHNAYA